MSTHLIDLSILDIFGIYFCFKHIDYNYKSLTKMKFKNCIHNAYLKTITITFKYYCVMQY